MNNINTLRNWLNHPDRKGVISIAELEKRIGCPRSTLGQWLTGKRPLPQKWEKPLLQQIEKLDFSKGLTGYASESEPKKNMKDLINMVLVEGGTFQMGSNDGQDDEKPVHTVKLSSFYMGKTAVTQAQWRRVMGDNPSYFSGCDQCPVENVSWEDIQEFLQKLNQMTGQTYRLPTEAEWEFAARGGNQSKGYKYAGSDELDEVGWIWKDHKSTTRPVAQKKPNELGLYDMSGNVFECCQDWYSVDYDSPRNMNRGRVIRGGSWVHGPEFSRVAFRDFREPEELDNDLGFRLVRSF